MISPDSSLLPTQRNPQMIRDLEDMNREPMGSSNLLPTILSNVFLFFLIFGLSATVHVKSLRRQLGNRFALLTGIAMQFVIMPLLGFAVVLALKNSNEFPEAMGIALLVVVSSPGGSYSNWWCSLFNADLPLSVAMTSVSTILSLGMLPANLLLYSHLAYDQDSSDRGVVEALDFGSLFISLGVVMGGILGGLYASYKIHSRTFQKWANRGASLSGVALILVSALLSSVGTQVSFWNQHWKFYVGVSLPCLVGLALANTFSRLFRLKKPECVAISIECCYQNTGIATSVAVTMYSSADARAQAVAVPLFYGMVEAVAIGLYCLWAWKSGWTKAPCNERLCVVVAKSYEVEEDDTVGGEEDSTVVMGERDKVCDFSLDDSNEGVEVVALGHWWQFWSVGRTRDAPTTEEDSDDDEIDLHDNTSEVSLAQEVSDSYEEFQV